MLNDDDPPPSLHGHCPTSSLLRGSPPLSGASVLSASRLEPLAPFPWHRRPGSHVPHKSQIELRAAYMPNAAWAVSVHLPSLSREKGQPPVLTSPNPLSTLHRRFAYARLSQSCLPESRSDFSATLTTMAFDHSSLRWLEIST